MTQVLLGLKKFFFKQSAVCFLDHNTKLLPAAMTSVIRIKRKRNCDPVGSLLLAKKRLKYEDSKTASGNDAELFRFAGTVEAHVAHSTEVVSQKIKKAIEYEKLYKSPQLNAVLKQGKRRSSEPFVGEPRKLKLLNSQTFQNVKNSAARRSTIASNSADKILKSNENNDSIKLQKIKKEVAFSDCSSSLHSVFDISSDKTEEAKENDVMCNNIKMIREKLHLNEQAHHDTVSNAEPEFVYDLYYCENPSKAWAMGDLLYVQPYQ